MVSGSMEFVDRSCNTILHLALIARLFVGREHGGPVGRRCTGEAEQLGQDMERAVLCAVPGSIGVLEECSVREGTRSNSAQERANQKERHVPGHGIQDKTRSPPQRKSEAHKILS